MTTTSSDASQPVPSPPPPTRPDYPTGCPSCGKELQVVALDYNKVPWLCNDCHRGFWAAELTPQARRLYRRLHHDWGQGAPARPIREAVVTEWLAAHERGTSLRSDQLLTASAEALQGVLPRLPVHPDFVTEINAELARRG